MLALTNTKKRANFPAACAQRAAQRYFSPFAICADVVRFVNPTAAGVDDCAPLPAPRREPGRGAGQAGGGSTPSPCERGVAPCAWGRPGLLLPLSLPACPRRAAAVGSCSALSSLKARGCGRSEAKPPRGRGRAACEITASPPNAPVRSGTGASGRAAAGAGLAPPHQHGPCFPGARVWPRAPRARAGGLTPLGRLRVGISSFSTPALHGLGFMTLAYSHGLVSAPTCPALPGLPRPALHPRWEMMPKAPSDGPGALQRPWACLGTGMGTRGQSTVPR